MIVTCQPKAQVTYEREITVRCDTKEQLENLERYLSKWHAEYFVTFDEEAKQATLTISGVNPKDHAETYQRMYHILIGFCAGQTTTNSN